MDTKNDAEEILLNTVSKKLIRRGDSLHVEKAQKLYELSYKLNKIINEFKQLKEAS